MIWRSIITRRRPKRPARQRGWPDVVPSRVSAHKWLAQRAKQEPKAVPRGAKRFCQCAFSGLQVQASKCSADFFCLWFFNPLNLQMQNKNKNETRQLHHIFLTSTAAGRHSESILSISEKISKAFRSRKAADFCLFIWWQDCAEKTLTSNNSCSSRSRNFFERSSCFRIFSSLECSQLLPKT